MKWQEKHKMTLLLLCCCRGQMNVWAKSACQVSVEHTAVHSTAAVPQDSLTNSWKGGKETGQFFFETHTRCLQWRRAVWTLDSRVWRLLQLTPQTRHPCYAFRSPPRPADRILREDRREMALEKVLLCPTFTFLADTYKSNLQKAQNVFYKIE